MLIYRSCVQRHLRAAVDLSHYSNITITSRSIISSPRTNHRRFATTNTEPRELHENDGVNPLSNSNESGNFSALPLQDAREAFLESKGIRKDPKHVENENLTDNEIKRELEFFKDPLKLADEMRRRLKSRSEGQEAQKNINRVKQIVRAASKDMECVVSWNHIINYELAMEKVNAALKTFNDMKKYGQKPDAYTYTIIFRGLADNAVKAPLALSHALSIYESMKAENSTVKPNASHTNAVLKVCSRTGDTDALFGIAASMPTSGFGSADNLTYTTIMNALRNSAVAISPRRISPQRSQEANRKATNNARRIWADVILRWRKADIFIDEELVCATGRVLLIGEEQDWDDVLSLVEQTMKIPRMLPRIGTAERHAIEPARQTTSGPQPVEVALASNPLDDMASSGASMYAPEVDPFKAVKPPVMPKSPRTQHGPYATPSLNTFSMVMTALCNLGSKAAATKYWAYFTEECGLKPDNPILCQYLRILRLTRSSSEVVKVLKNSPSEAYDATGFRLALSTCVRDKNNSNVFGHAGQILDLMQQHIAKPDIKALIHYIDVAMQSNSSEKLEQRTEANARAARGRQILRALTRLEPSFLELRSQLAYGDIDPNRSASRNFNEENQKTDYWQESLLFVRKMISAYDVLMGHNLVERETYSGLMQRRSALAAFVNRHMNKFPAPPNRPKTTKRPYIESATKRETPFQTKAAQTGERSKTQNSDGKSEFKSMGPDRRFAPSQFQRDENGSGSGR